MMNNSNNDNASRLMEDLHAVLADAQHLLEATAGQGGEALEDIRNKAGASIAAVKARLHDCESAVIQHSTATIQATDRYVHAHPWPSVGAAAVAGFLVGWLMKRS